MTYNVYADINASMMRGAAMMNNPGAFDARLSGALSGAFGGNTVPGPISHLVNRLGDNLVGGGYINEAMALPNYVPNADGHGLYFGPGVDPFQNDYFGGYKNQSYVNPYTLSLGHHNNPNYPGRRPTNAEMDAAVFRAIEVARDITQNTGSQPRIMIIG